MKCEIQWVSAESHWKPSPDENDAVAIAHAHEAIWSHPGGSPDNRIVGYDPNKIRGSFFICQKHLDHAVKARLSLENGGWTFTGIETIRG